MILAIDGPAGAGKSTIARAAAARLGYGFLDTGALYRAAVLLAMEQGTRPEAVAGAMDVRLGDRVIVNGRDVTAEIRTPEVTRATAREAARRPLRQALLQTQRELLSSGDWVAEGRDIGTVVAPHAELKVFLTASPEERARRRALEHGLDYATVLADIKARDQSDATRAESPLAPAPDAYILDTTRMDTNEVIEELVRLAEERLLRVSPNSSVPRPRGLPAPRFR